MSKNVIIRIIALIILGIGLVVGIVYAINKPEKETTGVQNIAGYSTITSVSGVSFLVDSSFTDSATAVTQISNDMDFSADEFYSFRDGQEQYILFNMGDSGVVVAVQKGTTFGFSSAGNKEENISSDDIMGIWFSQDKDKDKVRINNGRYEATVKAQVSITKNLFNDFIGKLVVLEDNGEEWAIFAGVPGDRYKEISKNAKNGIETIAESLVRSNYTQKEEEYAVVIDGTEVADASGSESADGETVIEVTKGNDTSGVEDTKQPESAATKTEDTPKEQEVTASETEPQKETDPEQTEGKDDSTVEIVEETEETEEIKEPEKSEASKEEVPEAEPKEDADDKDSESAPEKSDESESVKDEKEESTGTVVTKSTVNRTRDDTKAYTSSAYSMVTVGQASIFNSINDAGEKEDLVVRVDKILEGEEVNTRIQKALKDGKIRSEFTTAPAGCHWEGATYSVRYGNGTNRPYVNVKLLGVDGEILVYRGIKYPSITYDIDSSYESGAFTVNYFVYYAVPNGCDTYSLKVGDSNDIEDYKSAYYIIERRK